MLAGKNRIAALTISFSMACISWLIIIVNVFLRITTLFQFGIYNINAIGFTLVTILVSIYTFMILFKISKTSYFPILLILLHMAALRGSAIIILFVVLDLALLIALNTSPRNAIENKTKPTAFYYTNFSSNDFTRSDFTNTQNTGNIKRIDDENIIDAEFTTKE